VPGLAARMAAATAIAEIATGRQTLEDRFGAEGAARMVDLDARDRALARSITTVSLRRLGTLRSALAKFLDRGLPKKAIGLDWILVTGAAQILFMEVPDHAAVDLAVRAARKDQRTAPFAGLVNAVLRNIIREHATVLADVESFTDTPQWLAARWRATYGEPTARAIAEMHRQEPTLDLSVREDAAGWAERLGGFVLPTGSVRLFSHQAIPELEGFAEGRWWVQDAAAALPARLLRPEPGERIIDLCAAPGGKTASLAAAGAQVTALDRSAERLKRLTANLERLGLTADVAVGDVLTYSADPFDAVLLDAPCTATGTIRRHPDVAWTKKASDIASLATVQARMLDRAVEMLRPDGRLVYCVCSLEPEEGEAQIAALLRRNPDVARVPIEAAEIGGLTQCLTPDGDLRTLPSHLPDAEPRRAGLDGFFAARLVRRAARNR
jgi:16S rRNA (cytosine967-C5)-methyltransferase